jgi:beta-N-acetylhexosaminidase
MVNNKFQMESVNRGVDDFDDTEDYQVRIGNATRSSYFGFEAAVSRRVQSTQHIVYAPDVMEVDAVVASAASVIFVTRNADRSAWQIKYLQEVLRKIDPRKTKMVVLASCGPYDLLGVLNVKAAYVLCFEFTEPALEAAVEVIFGEDVEGAKGVVPVMGGRVR